MMNAFYQGEALVKREWTKKANRGLLGVGG